MLLTQRENLPHEDTERPDVTLGGVDFVENGLWRHPLERKSGLCNSQRLKKQKKQVKSQILHPFFVALILFFLTLMKINDQT